MMEFGMHVCHSEIHSTPTFMNSFKIIDILNKPKTLTHSFKILIEYI